VGSAKSSLFQARSHFFCVKEGREGKRQGGGRRKGKEKEREEERQ
jgi:hypothetical protein